VHHAPALACSIISLSFDALPLLAFLVQQTHAALMTYLSVCPQDLHGLPVYFRSPFRAALIRGEAN